MKYNHVFKALPHINEIWVTNDGEFHLHPHNGGKLITRDESEESDDENNTPEDESEIQQADEQPEVPMETEQPEVEANETKKPQSSSKKKTK